MIPSPGRIVHYHVYSQDEQRVVLLVAIILRVFVAAPPPSDRGIADLTRDVPGTAPGGTNGLCLLRVFAESTVPTDFNIWAPFAETPTAGRWSWPPR